MPKKSVSDSHGPTGVRVREDFVSIPTYEPLPPDKHPMFLEKRVYQGSSGKVYPLPVYNRISDKKTKKKWKAVHIENEFIKVMVLPEIGGRIHIGQDKTNGYDFFYRQNVIKPALVGLTGPWASGGVEFNWPQHHRPATFMPVDVSIEEHEDGSKTMWFSDHDPINRMKGMHGVCLHPGKSYIEVKVRAYNRTPLVQTFLWWANVGIRVHEGYQSFFPTDVHSIADHAKRAMTSYPLVDGSYYGVDYGERARSGTPASEVPSKFLPPHLAKKSSKLIPKYPANDLSWYANIPVPTSYMCVGSKEDFHGGYDHLAKAGVVHVANHHISPGKKQWTWGNHEFGYAWDRNLTDKDGPYIELMAGVYTDNQPDFSYLQPGETKTWSQFWFPIRDIGPSQMASTEAALSLKFTGNVARVGVSATERFEKAVVEVLKDGRVMQSAEAAIAPGKSFIRNFTLKGKFTPEQIRVRVVTAAGREILAYQPPKKVAVERPAPAMEPVLPAKMKSQDELFTTGLHLDQYRHATRKPEGYWLEAIRRDPLDSRCNNGLGLRALRRGEFSVARTYFENAIKRQTSLNPNPYDGEAYYNLGITLTFLGQYDDAYAAFYKSTWNQAWQSAAYLAIAELDCRKFDWNKALEHVERSLRLNTDNLRARDLRALILRKMGFEEDALEALQDTLALDSMDWFARHLGGEEINCNTQTRFDICLDFARAGFFEEAMMVLANARPEAVSGTEPLLDYYRGWLATQMGDPKEALEYFKLAAEASSDYCFPSRLEEIEILETAMNANPKDAKAPYYLGNLFYDKDRVQDGIAVWELSTKLDAKFSVVWRNLGIAYFNVLNQPAKALAAFDTAFKLNPKEPRLLYERDQLWKRLGYDVTKRLTEIEKNLSLVNERDDLTVELATLYNQTNQPLRALSIMTTRNFQPWEGGEGLSLGQHVRTHVALGRAALDDGRFKEARKFFERALTSPKNLGEAKHLLANQSDIRYWLGCALEALGLRDEARGQWTLASHSRGDFQSMSVVEYSEMTYFAARSLEKLGLTSDAQKLFRDVSKYAKALEKQEAKIDYFATSLPTMLLFNDDLQARQTTTARFMQALAAFGSGRRAEALALVKDVLKRDPAHSAAADFANELRGKPKVAIKNPPSVKRFAKSKVKKFTMTPRNPKQKAKVKNSANKTASKKTSAKSAKSIRGNQ